MMMMMKEQIDELEAHLHTNENLVLMSIQMLMLVYKASGKVWMMKHVQQEEQMMMMMMMGS